MLGCGLAAGWLTGCGTGVRPASAPANGFVYGWIKGVDTASSRLMFEKAGAQYDYRFPRPTGHLLANGAFFLEDAAPGTWGLARVGVVRTVYSPAPGSGPRAEVPPSGVAFMGAWTVMPGQDESSDAPADPNRAELQPVGGSEASVDALRSSARWDIVRIEQPGAQAVLGSLLEAPELKGTGWEALLRQELEKLKAGSVSQP
jgi:hypothetical protein